MDAIVPLHNLPNLKQGQNGVEVALAIYIIILEGSSTRAERNSGK